MGANDITAPSSSSTASRSASTAAGTRSRAVLTRFGGPEGFEVVRGEPLPAPGPGQIRVRTLAASVQFTDVIIRKGQYPDLVEKPPFTPGYDTVGEIDALGEGVRGLALGDRVADMTMTGGYASHRLLESARVTKVPASGVQTNAAYLTIGWWIARIHLWNALPNGKRAGFYSITSLRKSHPGWFLEDLGKLFGLLESGQLAPRIAQRIALEGVADAHRALEKGGLDGKIVIER